MNSRAVSKVLVALMYSGFFTIACVCINACQVGHDRSYASTATLSAGETLTADPTLESQAVAILSANCAGCHGGAPGNGGVHNITDKNSLYTQGLIVPGKGTLGRLVGAISPGGLMPPGTSLSPQDIQTIENWINSMQIVAGSGTPLPPPPPPLTDTYQSLNANIFVPYCVYCHGPNSPAQGDDDDDHFRLDTYQGVYDRRGDILEQCMSGKMPKGGPKLTTAELTALQDWINSGAPNN